MSCGKIITSILCLLFTACGSPPTTETAEQLSAAPATVSTVATPTTVRPPTTTRPPATPPAAATALPYAADWSRGPAGWSGTGDWSVAGGMLVSDGSSHDERAGMLAPLQLTEPDVAVEAEIRLEDYRDAGRTGGRASFGVMARVERDSNGYGAGHCYSLGRYVPVCAGGDQGEHRSVLWNTDRATLDFADFEPGAAWHTYRIELRGNHLTVLIDGAPVLDAVDNNFLDGGRVGLWSNRCVVSVRGFRVTAL